MSAVTNRLKPAKPQGDNFRQRLSQLKGSVQNCGRHSAWWKAPSPKHCYAWKLTTTASTWLVAELREQIS